MDDKNVLFVFNTWESIRARLGSIPLCIIWQKMNDRLGSARWAELIHGSKWSKDELQYLSLGLVGRQFGPYCKMGLQPDQAWVERQAKSLIKEVKRNCRTWVASLRQEEAPVQSSQPEKQAVGEELQTSTDESMRNSAHHSETNFAEGVSSSSEEKKKRGRPRAKR